MNSCSKCGKELGLVERNTIWNRQLKEGYFDGNSNKWYSSKFFDFTGRLEFPELRGKKTCGDCMRILIHEKRDKKEKQTQSLKNCSMCHYSTKRTIQTAKNSVTNLAGIFTGNGLLDYDYKDCWLCSKFDLDITYKLENADVCSSFVIESDYEHKCLSGEMDKGKANVQIILDFSSLKEVMSKGGLIMTTYKCPNCNGMVKLPEEGIVLVCEYCGTPIKPVDIFEKIKTLIQ